MGAGRPSLVVGFAAETVDVVANATAKRARKGCDWIVANDVRPDTGIMGGDENAVTLVTEAGAEEWPRMSRPRSPRALPGVSRRRWREDSSISGKMKIAGRDSEDRVLVVKLQWEEGADRGRGCRTMPPPVPPAPICAPIFPTGAVSRWRPGARVLVPTGLRLEVPEGYEVQVRPRSGLALKHGITLPNSPGTIDSDYRGPLGVIVLNAGDAPFEIAHGARIAQMVVAPVVRARFEVATALGPSARGAGGFGSTGRRDGPVLVMAAVLWGIGAAMGAPRRSAGS